MVRRAEAESGEVECHRVAPCSESRSDQIPIRERPAEPMDQDDARARAAVVAYVHRPARQIEVVGSHCVEARGTIRIG